MKKFIIFISLIITACIPPLTDDQITAMNNQQLCQAIKNDHTMDLRLMTLMNARGLQCHPVHIFCQKSGYKIGTKAYKDCVSNMAVNYIAQENKRQQDARELSQSLGNAFSQYGHDMSMRPAQTIPTNPTVTTHCSGYGNTVNCTTY